MDVHWHECDHTHRSRPIWSQKTCTKETPRATAQSQCRASASIPVRLPMARMWSTWWAHSSLHFSSSHAFFLSSLISVLSREQDSNHHYGVGSPSTRLPRPIIGAEDDDFDTDQEQVRTRMFHSEISARPFQTKHWKKNKIDLSQMNGQCSCFQSIELLKSRPAHLAAFLHHVVSQFDPAPLVWTKNLNILFILWRGDSFNRASDKYGCDQGGFYIKTNKNKRFMMLGFVFLMKPVSFPALAVLPLRRALQAEQPQRDTADIRRASLHVHRPISGELTRKHIHFNAQI